MKATLEILLENGLNRNGLDALNFNGKVYGNAIYLNGNKIVLKDEVLQNAKCGFRFSESVNEDVIASNLWHLIKNEIPFVREDIKDCIEKLCIADGETLSEDELNQTIEALKNKAMNELITGISGLRTNEQKEARFNELVKFIIEE